MGRLGVPLGLQACSYEVFVPYWYWNAQGSWAVRLAQHVGVGDAVERGAIRGGAGGGRGGGGRAAAVRTSARPRRTDLLQTP